MPPQPHTRPEPVVLRSGGLVLRPWRNEDAAAALAVYGDERVTRWLRPGMARMPDLPTMRSVLGQWSTEQPTTSSPAGRWAIELDGRVIGGISLLPLPPGNEDLEISWQLHADFLDQDHASESAFLLSSWAFRRNVDELYAVVRPGNTHLATTVRRNGMHWVGETSKYFGTELQVFRIRPGDLDRHAAEGLRPPNHT